MLYPLQMPIDIKNNLLIFVYLSLCYSSKIFFILQVLFQTFIIYYLPIAYLINI